MHAGGREYQKNLRETIPIGIFGSFSSKNLKILQKAQRYLIEHGFSKVRISSDLMEGNPQLESESYDEYNLRLSDLLVHESRICIFFFFGQRDSPVNINESTLMELATHRITGDHQSAYLLVHEDVNFAGIAKGTMQEYPYFIFREHEATYHPIRESRVREIIRSHPPI